MAKRYEAFGVCRRHWMVTTFVISETIVITLSCLKTISAEGIKLNGSRTCCRLRDVLDAA